MANHTIRLQAKKGAVLPPGATIHSGDTLLWDNQTDRGRAVIFSVWPFKEVSESIRVPGKNVDEGAGKGKSKSYVVAPLDVPRTFPYTIDPTINPDDGPPDEPDLTIQP